MRKKSKLPLFLCLILLIASNLGNYWYFNIYCEKIYKSQSETYEKELTSYKTQMYVATSDIPAGTKVTVDLLTIIDGYSSNKTGLFCLPDLNKTAIANIPAGTTLYSNMVYNETVNPGNTAQYLDISFPNNAIAGNYIDVCIRYPNGNVYTVVSKTKLTGIDHDFGISHLTLTETEHQYLSSALVDAELYEASVYATIYSSPETQTPATVTYVPREDSLPLIYKGADLVTYRKLRENLERQIGETL